MLCFSRVTREHKKTHKQSNSSCIKKPSLYLLGRISTLTDCTKNVLMLSSAELRFVLFGALENVTIHIYEIKKGKGILECRENHLASIGNAF